MSRLFELLERFDWMLLISALSLTAVGLVLIYGVSLSQENADLFAFYKQFTAAMIGLALVFAFIFLDYRHFRSLAFVFYLAGAALLLGVLLFGYRAHGTVGWYKLGGLSFQPVEIAKITLSVYLGALIARGGQSRMSWRLFGLSLAATSLYIVLVILQPDFGSAMVLLAIWGAVSLFAGLPRRAFFILPVSIIILSMLVWSVGLRPYQRDRIVTFIHPTQDVRGSGYNAAQARIAIGSGGLVGKGIGEGSQARLRFLPEAATDFIFAVLGEELGFIGVALALGLFGLFLYRLVRLAHECGDDFAALMLVGFAAIILIHVIENAGMNLGEMPITGLPMPFLSSAASSLVVSFLAVGMAESVAVRRRGAASSAPN